jgi:nucleotide-binding universal stress UspA family protein
VRIGIPSDEIKVLTEERQIDMIVMGMKGVGGLDKLIGSTTINAIRKVRVPVLIIPQDAQFQPLQHITYATDLHYEIVVNAYKPLVALAKKFNARIHIVNVHRHNAEKKVDELEWRRTVENIFYEIEHDFSSVEDASVMHGIQEYIDHHSSELLVMISHRHTFFERLFSKNQTTAMAYETKIPLLILQDKP